MSPRIPPLRADLKIRSDGCRQGKPLPGHIVPYPESYFIEPPLPAGARR